MKKIDLLVLKAFVRPFVVTFFIVMFVLLMLFLFKYIDDLIGKNIEPLVIFKLMLYALAAQVSMALPLSVLLSSIMTFGSLGENYELVAIKSAGISLLRAMMPLTITVSLLSVGAFFFSDYILPVINLKYHSLMYDVRNQKLAFLIEEGVFNNNIPGYAIRVKKKELDDKTLKGIMIYDHNKTNDNINVLMANEGEMYKSASDNYLILKLKDGIRYEEAPSDNGLGDSRERFTRIRFKETEQKFDLSAFKLQRTDENLFKTNDMMLNLKQLRYYRDSVRTQIDSNEASVYRAIAPYYRYAEASIGKVKQPEEKSNKDALQLLVPKDRLDILQRAIDQVHMIKEELNMKKAINDNYFNYLKGYVVQLHKKFTLSVSCLVLFFIGAPLGAIIRKGGLGLPVVVSIICFMVYHIISTIGEKSVKEGSLSEFIGMWIAVFILAPVSAFITYKAAKDSMLFDVSAYIQFFKKIFSLKRKNKA